MKNKASDIYNPLLWKRLDDYATEKGLDYIEIAKSLGMKKPVNLATKRHHNINEGADLSLSLVLKLCRILSCTPAEFVFGFRSYVEKPEEKDLENLSCDEIISPHFLYKLTKSQLESVLDHILSYLE